MIAGRQAIVLAVVCLSSAATSIARGQTAWEYSPYEVRLWVVADADPRLPQGIQDDVEEAIKGRADVVFGAVWKLNVETAPPLIAHEVRRGLEGVTIERLMELAPEALTSDKLFLVHIKAEAAELSAMAKELDCRTRQWSAAVEVAAPTLEVLPIATWDAVAGVFTPLARIESVEGPQVTARIRGGGLIVNPASPASIDADECLRPIVRRNDRSGQPAKNGIQSIPWTLLTVSQKDESLLVCQLHSGYRLSIPTRGGVRTERLALVVRPRYESTQLSLQTRGENPRPLTGYEVHARSFGEEATQLLGISDWRGEFEVPRTDGGMQTLLVKNGRQLLARLPIVPGQEERMEVSLVDDDSRLQAEGAVAALYSRALDLVARREIVAARFRSRLKERKFDEAQELLDQFRTLETRADLSRALDEQQQLISASDKTTQARVDKIFGEARKVLLLKPLSDDMINTLAAELIRSRSTAQQASVESKAK